MIWTTAQMRSVDQASPRFGVPLIDLMEGAGRAVADEIGKRFAARPTAVLCGPGNNGGDGYVAARILRERGWPISVFTFASLEMLHGEAAAAFRRWGDEVAHVSDKFPAPGTLLVDALYGAGISRPLEGAAASFAASNRSPIVSIDVPSGIQGDTGHPLGGIAVRAQLTITFEFAKPAHLLFPGREYCGEVAVARIGVPIGAIDEIRDDQDQPIQRTIVRGLVLPSSPAAHKYDRGHCLVVSGGWHSTGASRLAAQAAARAGAGLTTIAAPEEAGGVHACHLTAIMVRVDPLGDLLADPRRNAVVIGPGLGLTDAAHAQVNIVLAHRRATVLDADALTLIAKDLAQGIQKTHDLCVLTPHGGEFARLFPDLAADLPKIGKLEATRAAARHAGATVLFKGADTVIATPDGRAAIDSLSPPWLATAGSGDVLAGLIGGLLAQGLDPFDAACGGVFLHGAAARHLGPGLIADDLPGAIPCVLAPLATVR